MRTFSIRAGSFLLALSLFAPGRAGSPTPNAAPNPAAAAGFDCAFRFASRLDIDPKDKSAAQEAVVLEYGYYVSPDEALKRADLVDGWRRGVVYAETAILLARAGRVDEARVVLAKAEAYRQTVTGWQNPRIASHIGAGYAVLGDLAAADRMSALLAPTDRQYLGRPVSIAASALASAGDFDGAMARLDALAPEKDEDIAWWRARGYVDVAQAPKLSAEQRLKALRAAQAAAAAIPGWRRMEALLAVAKEYAAIGRPIDARPVLESAERLAGAQSAQALPVKGPLLAEIARGWARAGDPARAGKLLAEGEKAAEVAMNIEQPAIDADLAAGYWVAGDPADAARLYDRALTRAEALENARPRALAVVEICRSIGREAVPMTPATRARLDALYAGLKDPW